MKQLDQTSYQEIRSWVHYNARPLEMALWNYMFEAGKKEDAINELKYYQNTDGGFAGRAEPDSWSPESSPYATITAIKILERLNYLSAESISHPIIQGIFRYLESEAHTDENGWMFTVPSNDFYPRAPWWTYDEAENKIQNTGITAYLCAFILRYADHESALFQKTVNRTHNLLEKVKSIDNFGEMGAKEVSQLLENIQTAGLSKTFQLDGLDKKIKAVITQKIERNPEKWKHYTPRPSEYITSPNSPLYPENKEIVVTELDYLIDTRIPGGVWNITWTWFDLTEQYAKEFAISENWWKTIKAIDNIEFLKHFDRVAN